MGLIPFMNEDHMLNYELPVFKKSDLIKLVKVHNLSTSGKTYLN